MTLDTMISGALYGTLIAESAIYIDAAGAETSVDLIPNRDQGLQPDLVDRGVLVNAVIFHVLREQITPVENDCVVYDGSKYRIDALQPGPLATEWTLYVYPVAT